MSWMEERRFDWTPICANALSQIMQGSAVILLTDNEREWFAHYVTNHVNKMVKTRPFLPVYNIHSFTLAPEKIKNEAELACFFDMLDMTFKEYFIWYIGRNDDTYIRFTRNRDNSFLWVFDHELQNSFTLRSYDDLLDFKLLHLYRLFDKSIDAVLAGEVELEL